MLKRIWPHQEIRPHATNTKSALFSSAAVRTSRALSKPATRHCCSPSAVVVWQSQSIAYMHVVVVRVCGWACDVNDRGQALRIASPSFEFFVYCCRMRPEIRTIEIDSMYRSSVLYISFLLFAK